MTTTETPAPQAAAPTARQCAANAAACLAKAQELASGAGLFVQADTKTQPEILTDLGRAWMELGSLIAVTAAMQPDTPDDTR